jgi:hypothetical protein
MRTIHGAIPSWPGLSQGLSRPSTSSTGAAVSYTVGALSAKRLGRVQVEPRGWPGQARP